MSKTLFAVLGGALLASAGVTAAQPDPADKPVADTPPAVVAAATADRTLRAESLDGTIVNTIYLDGDGSLRIIREADGGTTRGHWFARNDMVCLDWQPRGRECWPFDRVASHDHPVVVTSDRGQSVRVTLLG